MKILEQSNDIERGVFEFKATNMIEICSNSIPGLTHNLIQIRGYNKKKDDRIVSIDCEDDVCAKSRLDEYVKAIRECNNYLRKRNEDIEVEVVIAE